MKEKKYEVDAKDYAILQTIKAISKEDKQRTRLESIKINNMKLKQKEREVKYKRRQLEKNEPLEKHEDFIDGKKPLFMLESDIDLIQYDINQLKESNKVIQEEYNKDV